MQLQVTDNAYERIIELNKQNHNTKSILRISVDGGGCSGFMYKYEFTDTIHDDDFIINRNETRIVVDSLSQQFLNNCTVDFVEELGSNYFEIRNPQATAKCGCGNSFAV